MTKTIYAIRQKSTKWFLPQIQHGNNYTKSVPKENCLPRIFRTAGDAKKSLRYYVQGVLEKKHWVEYGQSMEDIITQPGTARDINDYEIVEGTLFLSNFNTDEQLTLQENNDQLTLWLKEE